jgi:hypothetical protein
MTSLHSVPGYQVVKKYPMLMTILNDHRCYKGFVH